jgi:hypothetical protein
MDSAWWYTMGTTGTATASVEMDLDWQQSDGEVSQDRLERLVAGRLDAERIEVTSASPAALARGIATHVDPATRRVQPGSAADTLRVQVVRGARTAPPPSACRVYRPVRRGEDLARRSRVGWAPDG